MIKNNKGFSLLELLIVIAVSAVIMGFATVTLAVVDNANVAKATDNLEAAINSARVTSMSKGQEAGKLTITNTNGIIYAKIGEQQPEKISSNMIEPYFFKYPATSMTDFPAFGAVAGSSYLFGAGSTVEITFNSAGMITSVEPGDFNCFVFRRENRALCIKLFPETGKVVTSML